MTPEEFVRLRERCSAGMCNPEELKSLMDHGAKFQLLDLPWTSDMGDQQQTRQALLAGLHIKMKVRSKVITRYFQIAAGLLLVSGATIFLYPRYNTPVSGSRKLQEATAQVIVQPGTNKATLTLSDGSNIDLDDSKTGTLCRQGVVTVGKRPDGSLVYQSSGRQNSVTLYNTITTPKGGQYQVLLSDGTRVWLNAASALKYPVTFSGSERKVELIGEAYFEVAKNKNMPFKVSLNTGTIEVLGTHFNVNAYPDEPEVTTTLLEGAVKLSSVRGQSMLKPGQQATWSKQNNFNIHEVNTDEAVAWKNGYFIFDKENIQHIMRKISRWYDVDIDYSGSVDEGDFGGTASRSSSISGVLKSLELTGTVHFKVQGRRITVMP
jgi:transmembrane sensor